MKKAMNTDNILIKCTKNSCDYFKIQVHIDKIMIYRESVPGRVDLYSFKMGEEIGIRYFSDFNYPMLKGINMLIEDLKNKSVKKLINSFGNARQRKRIKDFIKQIIKED